MICTHCNKNVTHVGSDLWVHTDGYYACQFPSATVAEVKR